MIDKNVEWTFTNLSFLVTINPYMQMTIGTVSLLIAIVLFYVVIKSTPEELIARRASVITQLVGCILQALLYPMTIQPIPLCPHRAVIFTGPLRHINSFACTILFVLWTANSTFMASSAMFSSVAHFLGTMEGMRQKNPVLDWYSKLSFRTRSLIITFTLILGVIWSAISMFSAIDYSTVYADRTLAFLSDNYALLRMRTNTSSLILGTSFSIFVVVYLSQVLYFNRGVWVQLHEIKSSISPRTWEILNHTSRLFLGIAIQPIISFVIPTTLFILLNFGVESLTSPFLLSLSVWTTLLLSTSSTFLFYLLTLISFKIYRHHFISILCSPFSFICTYGVRRVSVAPNHHSIDGNKEGA